MNRSSRTYTVWFFGGSALSLETVHYCPAHAPELMKLARPAVRSARLQAPLAIQQLTFAVAA